jgi:hypothetical protein
MSSFPNTFHPQMRSILMNNDPFLMTSIVAYFRECWLHPFLCTIRLIFFLSFVRMNLWNLIVRYPWLNSHLSLNERLTVLDIERSFLTKFIHPHRAISNEIDLGIFYRLDDLDFIFIITNDILSAANCPTSNKPSSNTRRQT